jgi:LuxR family maltose regulon positive regulatory protein
LSGSFLTTKLYVPPIRPDLVSRPRLVERLDAGLGAKLTLVSAPAGYGKTTLLSEWIHQGKGGARPPLPVAWLSLDDGDNDPARFLSYLIGAAQTIVPRVGEGLLDALQSPQPPPAEVVLTSLINDLAAIPQGASQCCPLGLVLDDYHLVVTGANELWDPPPGTAARDSSPSRRFGTCGRVDASPRHTSESVRELAIRLHSPPQSTDTTQGWESALG